MAGSTTKGNWLAGGSVSGAVALSWLAEQWDWGQRIVDAWPWFIRFLLPVAEFVLSDTGQTTLLLALLAFGAHIFLQRAPVPQPNRRARRRTRRQRVRAWALEHGPLLTAFTVICAGFVVWFQTRPDWSITVIAQPPKGDAVFPITYEVTSTSADLRTLYFRCLEHEIVLVRGGRLAANGNVAQRYVPRLAKNARMMVSCDPVISDLKTIGSEVLGALVSFEMEYSTLNEVARMTERRTFRLVRREFMPPRWDLTKTNWDVAGPTSEVGARIDRLK